MLKNKLRCFWVNRKKRRDYFVNHDYKQRQYIKTKESNHAQHKSDNDNIPELIILLKDLFIDNSALETSADKLRTSRSSTHKYIWRMWGNMGQMIEGIVYIRYILKKIPWKKKARP